MPPIPRNPGNPNAAMMGAVQDLTTQLVSLNEHLQESRIAGATGTVAQRSLESVQQAMSGPQGTIAYQGTFGVSAAPAGASRPSNLNSQASQQPYKTDAAAWQSYRAARETRKDEGQSVATRWWSAAKEVWPPRPPAESSASRPPTEAATSPTVRSQGQVAGALSPDASTPSGGNINQGTPAISDHAPLADQPEALTFGVLGEAGGPQAIRNLLMEQYAVTHQLQWASRAATQIANQMPTFNPETGQMEGGTSMGRLINRLTPGVVNAENMQTLSGLIASTAQNAPWMSLGVYKAGQAVSQMGGTLRANLENWQGVGNTLGYGGAGGMPQSIFGMPNPLSLLFGPGGTATAEGASLTYSSLRAQGLLPGSGFGAGLSSAQATGDLEALAAQGFANQQNSMNIGTTATVMAADLTSHIPLVGGALAPIVTPLVAGAASVAHDLIDKPFGINLFGGQNTGGGDADRIMKEFIEPLQRAVPGLSSADATSFSSALRLASTSTAQLSDTFSSFNDIAKTTKMSVGDVAAAFNQVADASEQMGATRAQGLALASTFAGATGLDPAAAVPAMNNQLIQGMMLSQNGIMPAGIPAAGGGLLGMATLSALQLVQNATKGFDVTKTRTLSNGMTVPIVQGKAEQRAVIASMFPGLPQSMINAMLNNPKAVAMGSNLEMLLGSSVNDTGLWARVNANHRGSSKAQIAAEDRQWSGFAGKGNSNLKALGMSKADIAALSGGPISSQEKKKLEGWGVSDKKLASLSKHTGQSEANRLNLMNKFIEQAQGTNPQHKIRSTPSNAQDVNVKVSVGFTGKAATFFQQTGVSPAKKAHNAGGASLAQVAGTVMGAGLGWSVGGPVGAAIGGSLGDAAGSVIDSIF